MNHSYIIIYDPNHLFERISILYIDDSHIHHHANYSLNSMIHVYSPRNDHDDPLIAMIFFTKQLPKKRQVHPLVTRILAVAEGTSPARLAECIGRVGPGS